MSPIDSGDLPSEPNQTAERLHAHRYRASVVELDQIKTRILNRASGQRVAGGRAMRMHKRSRVTAAIMFAAIGAGSAGSLLASTGISASAAVYGSASTIVSVSCNPGTVTLGQSTVCTGQVDSLFPPFPTGTITFTGTGAPAYCGLLQTNTTESACSANYTPGAVGIQPVTATYSGDSTYSGGGTAVTDVTVNQ